MQTTGELVVLVAELAAGMQLGKDQFDARYAFFRVDIHRHATAIVEHFQRIVLVEDHLDRLGVPGQGFVDAVVDDFLGQVVGACGVGVHARALAHRVEAGKDFDGVCVIGVLLGHRVSWSSIECGKVGIAPKCGVNAGKSEECRQAFGEALEAVVAPGLDAQGAGAVVTLGVTVVEGFVAGL